MYQRVVDILLQCAGQSGTATSVADSAAVCVVYVVTMSLDTASRVHLALRHHRVLNVRTIHIYTVQ